MKKLMSLSMLVIITGILFSSCGGSYISITKRHYNKGYYIVYNNGKHAVPLSKGEYKTIQTKPAKSINDPQGLAEQNTIDGNIRQNAITTNNAKVTSNKKVQANPIIQQQGSGQTIEPKTKIINNPVAQIKRVLSESKNTCSVASDHDGLSLFWVVILIILVLWAIGFVGFGLVGLINVLLVIALILLILWLLQIV